jgi:purine-binding chemotaxis protein CheW
VSDQQYCTFFLDGHYFGIPVVEVQEVIRYQEMTSVPLAPAVISGLINLRGQIVTAMDLRVRLDLPPRPEDALPMNVVIRTDDGWLSLVVDQISDVVEVDEVAFERPPETLSGVARSLIKGAYKLNGRLLLVLDTAKAVSLQPAMAS